MQTLSTKNIYIIGLVSLVLGLLFDYLIFDKLFGVSFGIYITLLLAGFFLLAAHFKISFNKKVFWFVPFILFFSFMPAVRDNGFLTFWNFVITIGLLLLFSRNLVGKNQQNFLFFDYVITAIFLPFKMVGKSFVSLARMLAVGRGLKQSNKTTQVIKGIAITLPIVLFFLALMSSADLVFNSLVSNIFRFDLNLNPNFVAQTWWAVFFSVLWLGVYSYILEGIKNEEVLSSSNQTSRKVFGNIETGILFGALNLLFLIFVIIQVKYLFAGHSAIWSLGLSYAEYAHKGFGELVAVALLTFGIIFFADKYIKQEENKHSGLFKTLSVSLIGLVLVIMASAFMRLSIYEQAYSFTLLRILVQGFIIWLAAVFLWLVYKIIFGQKESYFLFGIFASAILFFMIFNLLNPDAFVIRKNVEQFALSGKLDSRYLWSLSADAVPELATLLDYPIEVKDKYGYPLSYQAALALNSWQNLKPRPLWQSFNFSRHSAQKLIESKSEKINNLLNHKPF